MLQQTLCVWSIEKKRWSKCIQEISFMHTYWLLHFLVFECTMLRPKKQSQFEPLSFSLFHSHELNTPKYPVIVTRDDEWTRIGKQLRVYGYSEFSNHDRYMCTQMYKPSQSLIQHPSVEHPLYKALWKVAKVIIKKLIDSALSDLSI